MAARNASFHEGALAGVLFGPLKLALALLLGAAVVLALAWTIHWVCVFKVWPEGIERLRTVLAVELTRGSELARRQSGADAIITGTANVLYGAVFRATGIHDMGLRFAEGIALSIPDTIVRNTYIAHRDEIEVAMVGTQLMGVRVATLVLMVPLAVLIYVVAAVDGLSQRAIRRASGGRESASLYHWAKRMQILLAASVTLGILIWPAPVDWTLSVLAFAGAGGTLTQAQFSYYKKHV